VLRHVSQLRGPGFLVFAVFFVVDYGFTLQRLHQMLFHIIHRIIGILDLHLIDINGLLTVLRPHHLTPKLVVGVEWVRDSLDVFAVFCG
jgi:hypothetical protein